MAYSTLAQALPYSFLQVLPIGIGPSNEIGLRAKQPLALGGQSQHARPTASAGGKRQRPACIIAHQGLSHAAHLSGRGGAREGSWLNGWRLLACCSPKAGARWKGNNERTSSPCVSLRAPVTGSAVCSTKA